MVDSMAIDTYYGTARTLKVQFTKCSKHDSKMKKKMIIMTAIMIMILQNENESFL